MAQLPKNILSLDHAACYAAMQAHDPRFDGRFFCGVSSTGIYCRPICRVKVPKKENCTFFPSAAAAESAGYRPCLRCRPELAPGLSPADSTSRLARSAARLIEEDGLAEGSLAELARALEISDRHLRRVFLSEFGVTPVQYLQTRRLLLAKSLLADTSLPITEVALTAGFGSVRRFNDLFLKRYRLAPSRFRHNDDGIEGKGNGADQDDSITLFLGYRPPYDWAGIVSFLGDRAIQGVEAVAESTYRRTVALRKGGKSLSGWIAVAHVPKRAALSVTVSLTLLPVLPQVLVRVRHLFDLDCDPYAIQEKLSTLETVSPELPVPGMRLPGAFDPFEAATRAVLGQQVTVKAARTLAGRFAAAFGEAVVTPFADICCTFPLPHRVCSLAFPVEDCMGPLGIIGSRARSIHSLAQALDAGTLSLTPSADPGREMARLSELPGFGPWTVQYLAMRVLGWPDAFPATDYGVKKALATVPPPEVHQLVESWRPWRSYATVSLWHLLSQAESRPFKASPLREQPARKNPKKRSKKTTVGIDSVS